MVTITGYVGGEAPGERTPEDEIRKLTIERDHWKRVAESRAGQINDLLEKRQADLERMLAIVQERDALRARL